MCLPWGRVRRMKMRSDTIAPATPATKPVAAMSNSGTDIMCQSPTGRSRDGAASTLLKTGERRL